MSTTIGLDDWIGAIIITVMLVMFFGSLLWYVKKIAEEDDK